MQCAMMTCYGSIVPLLTQWSLRVAGGEARGRAGPAVVISTRPGWGICILLY